MGDYHNGGVLPSLEAFKNVLGGYISSSGVLRFPLPDGNPKNCCCTLKLDPAAPNGFVVSDASRRTDDLQLKDHVRSAVGLPPFSRAAQRRPNGVAKDHRPAGGPIAHDQDNDDKPTRIRLVPFGQIRLSNRPQFLIDRFIPRVGLTVIWGAPKSGKSFLVFDMAMHVVLDRKWRGLHVENGAVVYCAFEGQTGLEARVEAFRQRHLPEDHDPLEIQFHLMPVTINLVREQQDLVAGIRDALGPTRPALIVLDTLSRSLEGSESNDEDMANYVRASDAIREAFECAIAVVHHCGHNSDRPRGHTCLIGAADAVIAVKKNETTGVFDAIVEMMKDGETGAVVTSRLEQLAVGWDQHGREVTSCIVHAVEGVGTSKPASKLSDRDKIALKMLEEVLIGRGEPTAATGPIPPRARTVVMEIWRQAFYAAVPTESDKQDTKQKAFKRAYEKLQSLGIIGIYNDRVWLTGHGRTSPDRTANVWATSDRTGQDTHL